MTVTRDQLYEQVWARPMLAVAKDYEVSANYLARVCAVLERPMAAEGLLGEGRGGTEAAAAGAAARRVEEAPRSTPP